VKPLHRIAIIALVIYLSVAGFTLLTYPRLAADEQMMAARRGISCDRGTQAALLWPIHLKYFYFGGFQNCRKRAYR
jgi:hypothetical protein